MSEDLKRAREYGDAFRKYLLAALTGGVGVTLSVAGALVGKGVPPKWANLPILMFCTGLIVIGAGLLMGEHRSILRKRDPNAQATLPWYKMGVAWNLFAFSWFIAASMVAIFALNRIDLPREPTTSASSKEISGGEDLGSSSAVATTAPDEGTNAPAEWFDFVRANSDEIVPSGNSVDVSKESWISYADSVITKADIPPPVVTAVSGRAKFLFHDSDDPTGLGYVVTVSVDPLDVARIPKKYKTERIIQTPQGPLTILPLEQASYEVHFLLRLIDRDGFELLSVESSKHNIRSGTNHQIQGQIDRTTSRRLAAQTQTIALHMVIDRCLSCGD
jgi:hypothetical protein